MGSKKILFKNYKYAIKNEETKYKYSKTHNHSKLFPDLKIVLYTHINGLEWIYKDFECYDNSKACTYGGTNRKSIKVSGYRARMKSKNGRKVIASRRAKGREVYCPASILSSKKTR